MNEIQSKSVTLKVSQIHPLGWWLGNSEEHVAEGTALGLDFTENIYVPSASGLIGKYNSVSDNWVEVEDKTDFEFYSPVGERFTIGMPDGDYPAWAIKNKPPEYDKETQTILYDVDKWVIYDIKIGLLYWDDEAREMTISDYNFILPEKHTFTPPPKKRTGFALRLINAAWQYIEDNRDRTAYAKSRDNMGNYQVTELGTLPDTHTLKEPDEFDSWIDDTWQYDIERERPVKIAAERNWRDGKLTQLLSRIDQYEKDKNYPAELRTSPIKSEADFLKLLSDRKLISDYPDSEAFPFGSRPSLSNLIK
ncbi:hypothetical protein [Moritella viscosa]|uniref:Uncharacterized protein n=1 Tax=Moritella viscosa TaxID=80854 RepID=A0ABY1HAQ0_9GAMM|nr:hypothetical protein [Moritella viscosa]CED61130.1 tail fiber assembly protein [Moritella viscosa]SGY85026.1 Putative uncharacterized protein [Moritella viscosa]SGY87179.1 Putative uncharacterized protein [Moritella viscosa]SHN99365.1 Putative uncharacterized protein [Moritella viscosa]SHO24680.1 Putative uncharacterized protein [Moritella viscosa]